MEPICADEEMVCRGGSGSKLIEDGDLAVQCLGMLEHEAFVSLPPDFKSIRLSKAYFSRFNRKSMCNLRYHEAVDIRFEELQPQSMPNAARPMYRSDIRHGSPPLSRPRL